MAGSLTRWTWVWVNSRSWWWTGRPGMLRFMGSQRVGHNWATDLIWHSQRLWVINKAELDVFMDFSCFFYDPTDVGNLNSGSSAFSKSSLNIWKFTVHILLKLDLENFDHCFASVWEECNHVIVWTFFGIAFLWDWKENWPFLALWPLPLEKGMANHFIILALRTPWTVWKGKDMRLKMNSLGLEVPNMLLEKSREIITPERMKKWSQSENNTQLWMWLVMEVKSDADKNNIV